MNKLIISDIKNKIFTMRGLQVMLDKDLADFYNIETRVLKQAVKRNINRFPEDFMFILTENEIHSLVSQSVIASKKQLGGAKPYVFTEQGVSNLSAILSSEKAIEINIQIMRAFVTMRNFIYTHAQIFQRLNAIELKQIKYDKKFDAIFKALKTHEKKQGIFYDGQVFEACVFVSEIIRNAKKEIILIDNYIDESVLTLISKKKEKVNVNIFTKKISAQLALDIKKFTEQFGPIQIQEFNNAHDRFLIIDSKEIYHFGASLKDLGKKWFAFSKFETGAVDMLKKIKLN
ncbi:ORF6N domain-containing protein [Candidatus Woesearchaeota archaeon]|nr:ORF6N domain-containing protein [Candidatus Woesearchaeota archaeon]